MDHTIPENALGEESCWGNDRCASPWMQREQIHIAADQQVRLAHQCQLQKLPVLFISTGRFHNQPAHTLNRKQKHPACIGGQEFPAFLKVKIASEFVTK